MRTSLNLITLGRAHALDTQVKAAGEAGFQGIEPWFDKIEEYLQANPMHKLVELIDSYGMKVAGICSVEAPLWSSQDDFAEQIKTLEKRLDLARALNAESVVLIASDLEGHTITEAENTAIKRLRKAVNAAEERGLKLGLEFIGFWEFLHNVGTAEKIIEALDNEHLGMTFDTFHFFKTQDKTETIRTIPREKLFLVHVNDATSKRVSELRDSDRVYCGRGIMPLRQIMAEIRRLNYDGFLSVELFNQEYWRQNPFEVAETSLSTLRQAFGL